MTHRPGAGSGEASRRPHNAIVLEIGGCERGDMKAALGRQISAQASRSGIGSRSACLPPISHSAGPLQARRVATQAFLNALPDVWIHSGLGSLGHVLLPFELALTDSARVITGTPARYPSAAF